MSEWAKSKIDLNTLQYNEARENIDKKRLRDDEEYMLKKQRANDLHNIRLETEKKLGELQVKEMELKIQHLIQKHKIELEILNLEKNLKLKEAGLNVMN